MQFLSSKMCQLFFYKFFAENLKKTENSSENLSQKTINFFGFLKNICIDIANTFMEDMLGTFLAYSEWN